MPSCWRTKPHLHPSQPEAKQPIIWVLRTEMSLRGRRPGWCKSKTAARLMGWVQGKDLFADLVSLPPPAHDLCKFHVWSAFQSQAKKSCWMGWNIAGYGRVQPWQLHRNFYGDGSSSDDSMTSKQLRHQRKKEILRNLMGMQLQV